MKIEQNKKAYIEKYKEDDTRHDSYISLPFIEGIGSIALEFPVFQKLKEKGMFGLVTTEFADELAKFLKGKKVLEVMAGAGYLAHELHARGVDIIATDNFSWGIRPYNDFPIENLTAGEAIKKYSNVDYILVSWIPMDDSATELIKAVKKYCPKTPILHIGEGDGGCTGNEYFFDNVKVIEDPKLFPAQSSYERFSGIHDYLELMICKK